MIASVAKSGVFVFIFSNLAVAEGSVYVSLQIDLRGIFVEKFLIMRFGSFGFDVLHRLQRNV